MTESERRLAALLQSTVPEPPESLAPSVIVERARADAEAAPRPPLGRIALRGLPPLLAAAAVVGVVATIATVSFLTRSSGPAVHRPTTPTTTTHVPSPIRSFPMTTANHPAGHPPATGGATHRGGVTPGHPGRSSPSSAPPSPPATRPTTPPSSSTPPPPPVCTASQLTEQAGSPSTDSEGATAAIVELDNSGDPCQLSGFPNIYLADSSGQQIGATATSDGSVPSDPVQLAAGGAAYFRLVVRNATTPCTASPSASVVLTLPDGPVTAPYQVAFCPDTDGRGLTVSAIHPTATIP